MRIKLPWFCLQTYKPTSNTHAGRNTLLYHLVGVCSFFIYFFSQLLCSIHIWISSGLLLYKHRHIPFLNSILLTPFSQGPSNHTLLVHNQTFAVTLSLKVYLILGLSGHKLLWPKFPKSYTSGIFSSSCLALCFQKFSPLVFSLQSSDSSSYLSDCFFLHVFTVFPFLLIP